MSATNHRGKKVTAAAVKRGARRCWAPLAVIMLAAALVFFPAPVRGTDDIVLGVATSLDFVEGRESLQAVAMAVDEINAAGGVPVGGKRWPLRLESIDLRDARPGVPVSDALERLETFIVEKNVRAIVVGPFRSEVLLAGMDIIARHRVPLLGAIAMSPASDAKILRDRRYRYIFRVCLNAKYLVDYLINTMKFLRQRYGFNKVYVMCQDVAWARTTASLMVKLYFDRAGWQIVGLDNYPSGAADFSAGLQKAEAGGAQVILPVFDMPESGTLVKQWNTMGSRALLCGFISPMVGPDAWRTFDGNIDGALNVIFELGNIPSIRWQPAMDFCRAFRKRYGADIQAGHGPAPAYESVHILAEAIQRAGSLVPDDIVDALEATDRTGVMGRLRFHKGHQVIFGQDPTRDALACIFQWQKDGRRKIVYPLSVADGEIELPVHAR